MFMKRLLYSTSIVFGLSTLFTLAITTAPVVMTWHDMVACICLSLLSISAAILGSSIKP